MLPEGCQTGNAVDGFAEIAAQIHGGSLVAEFLERQQAQGQGPFEFVAVGAGLGAAKILTYFACIHEKAS